MSGRAVLPRPARILIVDDEQVVAMDMEMQLTGWGYEVTGIAASGNEAEQLIKTMEPDLVLMDIQLRGPRNGLDVAAKVQHIRKLPIIFVTAFGNADSQERAEKANGYGFLTKPYRPEDLRAVVSLALERYRASEDLQ